MKKHRQLLALFICLVMSVSLLTGYSETKAATEEPTQSAEQDATQETAETRHRHGRKKSNCPNSRKY